MYEITFKVTQCRRNGAKLGHIIYFLLITLSLSCTVTEILFVYELRVT